MKSNAGIAQASHKPPRARANVAWQDDAACADANPNLFSTKQLYPEALLICEPCPVKAQCRELGRGMGDGVWGGVIQKGRPSISVADYLREGCGTEAGYSRHIKAGETPCLACMEEHTRNHARRVS